MNFDALNFKGILETSTDWLLTSGLQILLVVVLVLIALRVARTVLHRLFERYRKDRDGELQKRADTLEGIMKLALSVVILFTGLIIILGELGISIGPILAGAGILGLAVGFGAQNLVQDVISGFFILLEDQVRVGDVVQVADKSGVVEKITLRMIIMRDLSGNVHFIRNGKVDIVTNMTKDFSMYVYEIGVGYGEDVDRVMEVMRQVDEDLRGDPEFGGYILEPIEILGVDDFGDSAVIIKARTKTQPVFQWMVAREFKRRLKKRFDMEKIEIPFPHRTVYFGENTSGRTTPLRVIHQGKIKQVDKG